MALTRRPSAHNHGFSSLGRAAILDQESDIRQSSGCNRDVMRCLHAVLSKSCQGSTTDTGLWPPHINVYLSTGIMQAGDRLRYLNRPNFLENPRAHSKLSTRVQYNKPLTSMPSPTAFSTCLKRTQLFSCQPEVDSTCSLNP